MRCGWSVQRRKWTANFKLDRVCNLFILMRNVQSRLDLRSRYDCCLPLANEFPPCSTRAIDPPAVIITTIAVMAFASFPTLSSGSFVPHRHQSFITPRRTRNRSAITPCAKMVRVSVPVHVEAPRQLCYNLFSDLSQMSEWSSTLQAVERDAQNPIFSTWKFAWNGVRLSWRAKDSEPNDDEEPGTAIRWQSVSGLTHVGAVEFEQTAPTATKMVMTVDYDIASLLAFIMQTNLVSDFVQGAIESDLQRFRNYALRSYRKQKIEERTTSSSSSRSK